MGAAYLRAGARSSKVCARTYIYPDRKPGASMTTSTTAEGLARVRELGAAESWLAVLVTQRPSGRATPAAPSVSLVNAGVLPHPLTGEPVVAFVSRGATAKLANLRADPRATLVFRA